MDIKELFNALHQISKLKFGKILDRIPALKDITIQSDLIRPLERFCGVKWLRMHNIEKIYKLEDTLPTNLKSTHIFFISSEFSLFLQVLNQIANIKTTKFHIIITPRILISHESQLEEKGLYDIVTLHGFRWDLIHLDKHLLSFEIPLFREIYVKNDLSLLPAVAKGFYSLFCLVGKPQITLTIGSNSSNLVKQLEIIEKNYLDCRNDSQFDVFVSMDRSIDYVSTLLTSTTYNALLSELFRVKCGVVEDVQSDKSKVFLFTMNSDADSVYSEIKNLHISEVSQVLSTQTKELKRESQFPGEMNLSQMKSYVQTNLKTISNRFRFLTNHLSVCEKIINTFSHKFEKLKKVEQQLIDDVDRNSNLQLIEDLIITENENIALKLICLMSLTQQLSSEEYNNLKLMYLRKVGYNYLGMFDNLINCGLLLEPTKSKLSINLPFGLKRDFYSMANKMKLIPTNRDKINMRIPNCPSYVFGGLYIPLAAQIILLLLETQNDSKLKTKLDLIGGEISFNGVVQPFPLQNKRFLINIIGGLTFSEMAAFDLIEKIYNCKIVAVSDCILTTNDFFNASKCYL